MLKHQAIQPHGGWPAYYATAMLSYRYFGLESARAKGAYPMLPGTADLDGLAWVWTATDGSHVQRVRHGLFRLFLRDETASWYRAIDCHALRWPNFTCTDGRTRAMSAPTATRILFDELAFDRAFLPPVPSSKLALE
jgi:hypothetical protein